MSHIRWTLTCSSVIETSNMSYLQQAHYPFTVQRGYILHMFPPHILQIHNHQNTINLTLLLLIFSKWYKKYFVRSGIWNNLSHVLGLHVVKCIPVMYANCPYPGCPCSTVKTGLYYGIIFFSKGPTFVENQNFTGSLRPNFVGNWFVALQCMMIHYFFRRLLGCMFMGKDNSWNPRTLIPHKQWWFHSKYEEHTALVSKKKMLSAYGDY